MSYLTYGLHNNTKYTYKNIISPSFFFFLEGAWTRSIKVVHGLGPK